MKKDPNQNDFCDVMLGGLLSGIVATLVCFAYDIFYRMATSYGPSEFINVSSIIFIVNLLLLLFGIFYFAFRYFFKKGDLLFSLLMGLLTAYSVWKAFTFHRFTDTLLSRGFSQLLGGTLLIIGLCAMAIPLVLKNKKISGFFI